MPPARSVRGRCRALTTGNRTRPHCDLTLPGSFTVAGTAGPNRLRFSGRLRGATLPAGRYRLRATPRDAAGNTGAAKRTPITIRRG